MTPARLLPKKVKHRDILSRPCGALVVRYGSYREVYYTNYAGGCCGSTCPCQKPEASATGTAASYSRPLTRPLIGRDIPLN